MHGNAEEPLMEELQRTHVVAHTAAMPTARPAARCTGPPSATVAAHRRRLGASRLIGRVLAGDVTIGSLHGAESPR